MIKTNLFNSWLSLSAFILFLGLSTTSFGQLISNEHLDTIPELTLEEALKKDPSEVYKLNLKKNKLETLPEVIFQFKNLQAIDLTKNKFHYFPKELTQFQYLQALNLSNNKITTIPKEVGELKNLRRLILNQNSFSFLPEEIGNLKKLEFLDLWGTEISYLPEAIIELRETLKEIDMRVILMSNQEHKNIKALLPDTKIHFSKSCNCGF